MLNTDIVERGIFIDVEMRMNDPLDSPRMIGVLVDGRYTAYACDEIFRTSVAYQNEHKPAQNWLFSPAADIFSASCIRRSARIARSLPTRSTR
jgi:hypothetical protein